MQVEFLRTVAVDATLRDLIVNNDEYHWAVAWGNMTDAAKSLFLYPGRFKHVTFGVAFSQTHPDVVDALQGIKGARVATKFAGGTYHPKVYGFRSGRRASAIVGSANFTFGGLDKNWEAAIHVTGSIDEPFFADLFRFTRESAKFGEDVTPKFASAYRASFKRAAGMPKPPRDPLKGLKFVTREGSGSALTTIDWPAYVSEVNRSAHHDVRESLDLLRVAQGWFASSKSFAKLSVSQRKAIAGTIGPNQSLSGDIAREWGWFGSMKAAGDFANRIAENDEYLARAVDCIPHKGEVKEQHYRTFVGHFRKAFRNSLRKGGVPTASRLLAMKRPDTFLCVCGPNIRNVAARMNFSRTTLDLENYWDKVVEVIRLSDWYNVDKPDDRNGELWESRAAMLDAIFYDPTASE